MTSGSLRERLVAAWDRFWFNPQPAHRIALFRIVAPLAILGLLSSRLAYFDEFFTTDGFHVPPLPASVNQPLYIGPLGPNAALLVTALLVASGLALCLGWRTRVANVIFALLLAFVALFDRVSAVSVNKLGTTVMVALCFCPSGAVWSLDARRAARARQRPVKEIPGAPVRFLQVQLAVMYCASGLCKSVRGDWLASGYVLWSQIHGQYQTGFAYWTGRLLPVWAWPVLQGAVLTYELGAPLLLAWRRTRVPTLAFGICMHVGVGLLFRRLGYFSALMISLLTLYLPDRAQLALLSLPSRLVRRRRLPATPYGSSGAGPAARAR